ncbi:MAG: hypothetical protein Q4C26_03230 [Bacteroidales bacterium]|nr:hypothetical protein [Bacteroidales bacterium]
MKRIKTYAYCVFCAAALLCSIVCLCIKGDYLFAVADLLLLAFLALDFTKVMHLPVITDMHDRLFVFGSYTMVALFSLLGSIGYLSYYSYTVFAILMLVLTTILLLAYFKIITLPTKADLK